MASAGQVKLLGVGAAWFLSSALLSTWSNTTFLTHFPSPLGHMLVRFVGSAMIGTVINCLDPQGFAWKDLGRLLVVLRAPPPPLPSFGWHGWHGAT